MEIILCNVVKAREEKKLDITNFLFLISKRCIHKQLNN